MDEAGRTHITREMQDAMYARALCNILADTVMELNIGETDEGDLFYAITLPDGAEYLTFAVLGNQRTLYGPALLGAITWASDEPAPLAAVESLLSAQIAHKRLAA